MMGLTVNGIKILCVGKIGFKCLIEKNTVIWKKSHKILYLWLYSVLSGKNCFGKQFSYI